MFFSPRNAIEIAAWDAASSPRTLEKLGPWYWLGTSGTRRFGDEFATSKLGFERDALVEARRRAFRLDERVARRARLVRTSAHGSYSVEKIKEICQKVAVVSRLLALEAYNNVAYFLAMTTATTQNLDRDFLILLHDVARLLRTRFDQHARMHGMTRAQWVILARLSRQPGLSQNELAGICEVEPITVGRLVDRLEGRGLVERRSDPKDRRIRRLHLLPAAEPYLEKINKYKETMTQEISEDIDTHTQEVLVDTLLDIKSKLNAEGAPLPKLQLAGE